MAAVVATWSGRSSSSIFRGVLSAVLLVTAIIVGLLGMHTLNLHGTPAADAPAAAAMSVGDTGAAASHHTAVPAGAASHTAAQAHPSGGPTDTGDMSCAGCGTDEHAGMAMMCVLALLLALVLVFAPGVLRAWAASAFRSPLTGALTSRALPRAPSLHVLCISRT